MNKTNQIINLNLTELLNESTYNTEFNSPTRALSALLYNNSTSLYDNIKPQMGGNSKINNEHNLNVFSATSSYNTEQQYMSSSLNALLYNTNHQSGGSFDNSFKQAQLSKPLQTIKLDLSSLEELTDTTATHSDLSSPFNALLYNTNYYDKYDNKNSAERQLQLKRDPNYYEFYDKQKLTQEQKTAACDASALCYLLPKSGTIKLPRKKIFVELHEILYKIMILLAEFKESMEYILSSYEKIKKIIYQKDNFELMRKGSELIKKERELREQAGVLMQKSSESMKKDSKLMQQGTHSLSESELKKVNALIDLSELFREIEKEGTFKLLTNAYKNIIDYILYPTDFLVVIDPVKTAQQKLEQGSKQETPVAQGFLKGVATKISTIATTIAHGSSKIPIPLKIDYETELTVAQAKPLVEGVHNRVFNYETIKLQLKYLQDHAQKIIDIVKELKKESLANNWSNYVSGENNKYDILKDIKYLEYLYKNISSFEKIVPLLSIYADKYHRRSI